MELVPLELPSNNWRHWYPITLFTWGRTYRRNDSLSWLLNSLQFILKGKAVIYGGGHLMIPLPILTRRELKKNWRWNLLLRIRSRFYRQFFGRYWLCFNLPCEYFSDVGLTLARDWAGLFSFGFPFFCTEEKGETSFFLFWFPRRSFFLRWFII